MPSVPSYLYRNQHGIFYFQRRIPLHLLRATIDSKNSIVKIIRLSLRTRNRREAISIARRISMELDALAKQFFSSVDDYAYCVKKYGEYLSADRTANSWLEMQNFYDSAENEFGRVENAINRYTEWMSANKIHQNALTNTGSNQSIQAKNSATLDIQSTNGISLAESYDKFITEKEMGWSKGSDMEDTYRKEIFPLLDEICGDINTNSLHIRHITAFKEAVFKLPKNRRKSPKYRNHVLKDLLHIDVSKDDQLSNTTKKNYIDRLRTFLNFLNSNSYTKCDLSSPLQRLIPRTSRPFEERSAFSDEDLRKLFNSKQYVNGLHHNAFMFWVPLIGLLSGARLNEICQLHTDDIKDYDNIKIIDINAKNSESTRKSLKKTSHARLIPIHPKLVDLGFLDYVTLQRECGFIRLFPELPYTEAGKYSDKAQKWFNKTYTNKSNCNIVAEKSTFHSLRHNFIDYIYSKLGVSESFMAHYLGQSPTGGVGPKRYAKPGEISEVLQEFKRIDYSNCIDFSKIRPWKYHRFNANNK